MNKWLAGNGYWCPDCRGTGRGEPLDRMVFEGGGYRQFYANCPTCAGQKRIAATPEQVLRGAVPVTPSPEHHSIMLQTIEYGVASPAPPAR